MSERKGGNPFGKGRKRGRKDRSKAVGIKTHLCSFSLQHLSTCCNQQLRVHKTLVPKYVKFRGYILRRLKIQNYSLLMYIYFYYNIKDIFKIKCTFYAQT